METTEGELEAAERLRALGHYRDKQFATLVTVLIGLAAETNPEILREAISKVFDVSAIEEMAKRAMLVATEAQTFSHEVAREARSLFEAINADAERLETKIDELRSRLNAIFQKIPKAVEQQNARANTNGSPAPGQNLGQRPATGATQTTAQGKPSAGAK